MPGEVLPAVSVGQCTPTEHVAGEELSVRAWDSCLLHSHMFGTGRNSTFMTEQQHQSAALIIMRNGEAGSGRGILKISLPLSGKLGPLTRTESSTSSNLICFCFSYIITF